MTTLLQRLDVLERRTGRNRIEAIVREMVSPGFLGSPMVRAEFYGQTLLRNEGETEDAFRARAFDAAKAAAPAGQIARLIMSRAEPRMQ